MNSPQTHSVKHYRFLYLKCCRIMSPEGSPQFEHQGAAGGQLHVFGQVYRGSGGDVTACGMVADDLGIALHGHRGLGLLAVDDGEHRAALVLTGNDIHALPGDKLHLCAPGDDVVRLAPVQQTAQPLEHGILLGGAAGSRESVLRIAREAGLEICCGGLFGLGEDWEARLEFAATLAELKVDAVPVNFLIPVPGTRLEHRPLLSPQEGLAILSVLRFLLPGQDILVCGGRSQVLGEWGNWIFAAGANGVMTGDYLTTPGCGLEEDQAWMRVLGALA